jgi:N-succinyl-L-ornithine transcarbamylase
VDKDKDNAETVMAGFFKICYRSCCEYGRVVTHYNPCRCDYHGRVQNGTQTKVVLSWAPQALPQAVANSFVEMMQLQDADFVITS